MGNSSPLLLSLQGVSKTFHHEQQRLLILDHADFAMSASEIVAVVGPSGTGKSTFLHLCGLLDDGDDHQGTIHFQGEPCHTLKPDQKARIRCHKMGFIYQYHHLLTDLNALENVMIPLLIGGTPMTQARKKAAHMLDVMNLGERQNHYPSQLSGGEQQRVSIARALVHQPALILADEPTGDLDQVTAEHIYQTLLTAIQETHAAMIMVTHNLDLAQRAQRVVTVQQGKVVPFR